ncbi:hypothetical protein MPTK1_2g23160 [Marchantia polymorpha subsp. ruderalis]|uniref:2-phosphoglycerate kinase n=1 Tax=Marchantia polymorpha TaxID=3197 RepID=A0A2R6WN27_MARPO|nr:hypothetical protein MARPO_0072s0015 [Marchantia polymorpha]BBN03400.1 hypothetical protein Mp_2g23160 [Marchantia polymorpha subsp. ruderalis]|eukprot:PTQ35251.1 hypothetical protein MARPO_0072s0015 [Marchantia polymorpha]
MAPAHFAGRSDDDDEDGGSGSPTQQANTRPPRHTSSKYDFVKVRVWLGDNSDHYYVLSRFLVSRMLTVTKIPNHVAIKISLELKKMLIDNSLLDVSQSDLEANLFKLMERRGFGAEYIDRYKMMTRFHHQRVPLIILVCGTACVGKSTIATQLAQRLNLPNVLQTDMVYELLRTATDAPLASTPIWAREFSSTDELVTEFCRECRIVRKGLDGDLRKAMKDGKPVIIEGVHLDPSIYLMDEDNDTTSQKESNGAQSEQQSSKPEQSHEITAELRGNGDVSNSSTSEGQHSSKFPLEPSSRKPELSTADVELKDETMTSAASEGVHIDGKFDQSLQKEAVPTEVVTHSLLALSLRSQTHETGGQTIHGNASTSLRGPSGNPANGLSEEGANKPSVALKEASSSSGVSSGTKLQPGRNQDVGKKPLIKAPAKAIVVPIVLRMADIDHQTLLEEWIACRSMDGTGPPEEKEALVSKLRTIQEYLCSFEEQGMKVVNISATTFPQTLDWLHGYLLQCIERGCSPHSPKAAV